MRGVLVLLACTGCSSILGIEDFKLGDAGGGNEMGETGYCLGPMSFRVCVPEKPTNVQPIADLSFTTSGSPLCSTKQPQSWGDQGQPVACFIIASSVTLSGSFVKVVGERPLVIFASDTITVNTSLDAAGHITSLTSKTPGPGSEVGCMPLTAGSSGPATGGGAGGSFMTKGGNGGTSSTSVAGGLAAAADMKPPEILRGGCAGSSGQTNTGGMSGGTAGPGGGAVYLVAEKKIVISGSINVSGAPGLGGVQAAGGGGGGSGGMILLHAPVISGGGVLIANGGGGGGGAGSNSGSIGSEPTPQIPSQPAAGGSGTGGGGNGGFGFAGPNEAADGRMGAVGGPAAGGGGGGGGAGYIRANVALTQITSSPSVSIVPDP